MANYKKGTAMDFMRISSASNPLIKSLRLLHSKKGRQKENAVILEGSRLVTDAVKSNAKIKAYIVNESFAEKYSFLLKKFPEAKSYLLPDSLFKKISETDNPQGLIAVSEIPYYNEEKLKELKRVIVLENIQDPGNAGTIIRSADAFGFDGVIFSKDSVDPYNSKVIRSTMGSLFHIPVIISDDVYTTLDKLKGYGLKILAAHPRDAELCYQTDLFDNIAIVIGNEGNGLSGRILEMADKKIMIPMKGNAESLNASVAASVLLYESMRQRGT